MISKSGHLTAALVGLPNAGKSYVFHRLGGYGATIADYPFSTVTPTVHLASLDNLRIQIIDLPPFVEGTIASLPYGEKLTRILDQSDVLCIVLDASIDAEAQELILTDELNAIGVVTEGRAALVLHNRVRHAADLSAMAEGSIISGTRVSLRSERDFDFLMSQIARAGGYIVTHAKPPSQSPEQANRLWVEAGTMVRELAASVHKELARRLTGARVWGESARRPGQKGAGGPLTGGWRCGGATCSMTPRRPQGRSRRVIGDGLFLAARAVSYNALTCDEHLLDWI